MVRRATVMPNFPYVERVTGAGFEFEPSLIDGQARGTDRGLTNLHGR
jgi:hypothetical protein